MEKLLAVVALVLVIGIAYIERSALASLAFGGKAATTLSVNNTPVIRATEVATTAPRTVIVQVETPVVVNRVPASNAPAPEPQITPIVATPAPPEAPTATPIGDQVFDPHTDSCGKNPVTGGSACFVPNAEPEPTVETVPDNMATKPLKLGDTVVILTDPHKNEKAVVTYINVEYRVVTVLLANGAKLGLPIDEIAW